MFGQEVSIPSPVHSWTSVKPSTICLGLGDYFGFLDIEHMSLNLYKTLECLPKSTEALLVTHISSEEIALTRQGTPNRPVAREAMPIRPTICRCYGVCCIPTLHGCVTFDSMDERAGPTWLVAVRSIANMTLKAPNDPVHLAGNLIGLARDRIEVRSAADGQLLQSEAISHGMGLAVTESGLLIHGIRELYDIRVVSTEEQVRDLLERHGYDEAAELIARAEPEGKTRVSIVCYI